MESSLITELFLPLSLAIIMLGMGLSLKLSDFHQIFKTPKAVFVGLIAQLVVLPFTGFALMHFWTIQPEYAVGIILLAACPGGPTSNLFAYLGKCDTALSISLTAVSSIITIFTIPFIVNLAMEIHLGKGQYVALPVLQTILQIMIITIIPVGLGMYLKSKKNNFAQKAERPVKIASTILIIVIILGAILKNKEIIAQAFLETGLPALSLNIITLLLGFLVAKLFQLNFKQSSTISIESGIQNGTLAIAIAASSTLLNNPAIAIPPAVYSILMFFTGGLAIAIYGKINKKNDA
ncbi:MAG: bile acid:sodium symporter family protein [Flavobacteriaceae bacterium]|nr:bile acid:sodium symporter family protein [Flavobacteriaceae bacterium]